MEVTNIQKYIHTTPRKLRLVADMVRKMSPGKSLDTLHFTRKDAATDLTKAIETALGNAKQKGLNLETIGFKAIEINEGPKMRRFRAGTRGRVKPYKRRMAHIRIVLSDELVVEEKKVKSEKSKMKSTSQKLKVEEVVIPSAAEGSQDKPTDPSLIAQDDKNKVQNNTSEDMNDSNEKEAK